jgi:Flp pilus assembly protein TadG
MSGRTNRDNRCWRRHWRAIGLFVQRWYSNARGGIAVIFALAVPVIAVLACGVVDLAAVSADRNTLQDTADSAAIAAAKQLSLVADPDTVAERSRAYVAGQLERLSAATTYSVASEVAQDHSSVTVRIDAVRTSFFANMLPPGGWNMHAQATAAPMGRRPLCVLTSGDANNAGLDMGASAQLTAPSCLIHSNHDVIVMGSAWLQAGAVEAVGTTKGHISPAGLPDAPVISDPFETIDLSPALSLCTPLDLIYDGGVNVLAPGVHCGNITVQKSASIVLLPGEHFFLKGQLKLQEGATLQGADVVLVFDKGSDFQFKDTSQIRLEGRRTGRFAGFVVATTRENTHEFTISSSSARLVLGTIYIPNATLSVTGANNRVADESAWTVVVARAIKMNGSANLVLNANYASSYVPVPNGVGPSAQQVVLKR